MTLLVAASASLVIASAAAATIGVRQRQRRGVWWWITANLGLTAALAGHALEHRHELLAPAAAVLAMQWPIVTLVGMRRFFARGGSAVPPWADAVVLALTAAAVVGGWMVPLDEGVQSQILIGAMLFATVYAAVAIWRLEDFATTPVLHGLLAALAGSAALQATWWAIASFLLGAELAAADLTLGAWLAPAAVALLLPQLSLVMSHERNVAQLRASHRKLRHLVEVDPLTRLPNRRHFHELAAKAIQPSQELATVLVFDVDRLKYINEVLGHQIGDEALRQIGTVLRETLRRRDVAGRLGGDEFAAVLPRTRVVDVEAVISRINTRIDDRQVAPRIARVCLNVGATQMLANETLADALRRAEIKLETDRDKRREAEALADRMADSMPASEVMPNLAEALAQRRGPPSGAATLDLIPIGEVVPANAPASAH